METKPHLTKTAVDEIRRSSAQFCNSLSVACFAIGCLSPAVRLAESNNQFAPSIGMLNRIGTYVTTDSGLLSASMIAAAIILRLRAIHVLAGMKDRID